jgi:hypothetical protein
VRAFVDWLAQLFEQAKLVDQDLSRVRQLLLRSASGAHENYQGNSRPLPLNMEI